MYEIQSAFFVIVFQLHTHATSVGMRFLFALQISASTIQNCRDERNSSRQSDDGI